MGNNTSYNSPQKVGTDTLWKEISAGNNHSIALKRHLENKTTTSIKPLYLDLNINIYPNPSSDIINVSNVDDFENFIIKNICGGISKIGSGSKINIYDLNPGIYFIQIKNKVIKFIKI